MDSHLDDMPWCSLPALSSRMHRDGMSLLTSSWTVPYARLKICRHFKHTYHIQLSHQFGVSESLCALGGEGERLSLGGQWANATTQA